jgi:cytochrome b561
MALSPRLNSAFKMLMSIHWWMAFLYVLMFTSGYVMTHFLLEKGPPRKMAFDFHKSIGVILIALLTWRILVLLRVWGKKYTKRLPKFTPRWYGLSTLHLLMYLLMWGVPVSGVLLSNSFRPNNISVFGLLLPDFFSPDRATADWAGDLHTWLAYTFLCLIGLHLLMQWKVIKANWRRVQCFVKTKLKST